MGDRVIDLLALHSEEQKDYIRKLLCVFHTPEREIWLGKNILVELERAAECNSLGLGSFVEADPDWVTFAKDALEEKPSLEEENQNRIKVYMEAGLLALASFEVDKLYRSGKQLHELDFFVLHGFARIGLPLPSKQSAPSFFDFDRFTCLESRQAQSALLLWIEVAPREYVDDLLSFSNKSKASMRTVLASIKSNHNIMKIIRVCAARASPSTLRFWLQKHGGNFAIEENEIVRYAFNGDNLDVLMNRIGNTTQSWLEFFSNTCIEKLLPKLAMNRCWRCVSFLAEANFEHITENVLADLIFAGTPLDLIRSVLKLSKVKFSMAWFEIACNIWEPHMVQGLLSHFRVEDPSRALLDACERGLKDCVEAFLNDERFEASSECLEKAIEGAGIKFEHWFLSNPPRKYTQVKFTFDTNWTPDYSDVATEDWDPFEDCEHDLNFNEYGDYYGCVRILLKQKSAVPSKKSFLIAAKHNDHVTFDLLIRDSRTSPPLECLDVALKSRNEFAVETLLSHSIGMKPLQHHLPLAASGSGAHRVKCLIDAGATDPEGVALLAAVDSCNFEAANFLVTRRFLRQM